MDASGRSRFRGPEPGGLSRVAAVTGGLLVAMPAHGAAVEGGDLFVKNCQTCHTIEKGGAARMGPNLWGVFGRKAGTVEGFNYSPAMKESGIVWDEETIAEYVADPKAYVPGNRMAFPGLKKEEDIANLLAYLERRGQHPFCEFIESGLLTVGDTLRARLRKHNADVLVMGAYGRSRLSEMLIGGVTRDMLGDMVRPVLMSH